MVVGDKEIQSMACWPRETEEKAREPLPKYPRDFLVTFEHDGENVKRWDDRKNGKKMNEES